MDGEEGSRYPELVHTGQELERRKERPVLGRAFGRLSDTSGCLCEEGAIQGREVTSDEGFEHLSFHSYLHDSRICRFDLRKLTNSRHDQR